METLSIFNARPAGSGPIQLQYHLATANLICVMDRDVKYIRNELLLLTFKLFYSLTTHIILCALSIYFSNITYIQWYNRAFNVVYLSIFDSKILIYFVVQRLLPLLRV